MHKTNASISINVSPQEIFLILKDFKNYCQWNPWITIAGEAIEGECISISGRQFSLWKSLRYRVNTIKSPEQIIWSGNNWFNFLVSTTRAHMIYTKADGTASYITKFYLDGPLAGLVNMIYIKRVHKGLRMEAAALKYYCEKHFNKSARTVSGELKASGIKSSNTKRVNYSAI